MNNPELKELEKEYIRLRDEWYAADDRDEDLCRAGKLDKEKYLARCQQRQEKYHARLAELQAQAVEVQQC